MRGQSLAFTLTCPRSLITCLPYVYPCATLSPRLTSSLHVSFFLNFCCLRLLRVLSWSAWDPRLTIRHSKCDVLLSPAVCPKCITHRKVLISLLSRHNKGSDVNKCAPDSRVNYPYLSTPEKVNRLQHLHTLQRHTRLQLEALKRELL